MNELVKTGIIIYDPQTTVHSQPQVGKMGIGFVTMSSNVNDALNVRNTFAVSPGISSLRWAFSLLVSNLSKRSSPPLFPAEKN